MSEGEAGTVIDYDAQNCPICNRPLYYQSPPRRRDVLSLAAWPLLIFGLTMAAIAAVVAFRNSLF